MLCCDYQPLVGHYCRVVFRVAIHVFMFRAIGVLIILWGFSQFFTASFAAFDQMLTSVFGAIETAAEHSETSLEKFETP